MDNQDTPLGRIGFLVIPIGILLAFFFTSFWIAVCIGAAIGLLVANVRAVLFVGRMRSAMERNPLLGLQAQAQAQGAGTSTQIRYIFYQSLVGGLVFAVFTAIATGIASLIR